MVSSRMWYHEHSPENIQINYIERTVDGIDTGVRRIYIGETYVCLVHICIFYLLVVLIFVLKCFTDKGHLPCLILMFVYVERIKKQQ